jgi:hypothetical protein
MNRTQILLVVVVTSLVSPSLAMDKFEIQVYEGGHNDPWQPSLELHSNYTPVGHSERAYAAETPPDRALRFTLEPALGISDYLELGAYLQTMVTPSEGVQWGGWKLRAKFVVPERLKLPVILGINVELGRVPASVEEAGWANEFRPIIGVELGQVGLFFNPIFGFALTGAEKLKPDFEPAFKAKWNTNRGFALGVEHFASIGRFDKGFDAVSQQEHLTFVVFDLDRPVGAAPSAWELNVAVGRSLTEATPQKWVMKAIVGHSF